MFYYLLFIVGKGLTCTEKVLSNNLKSIESMSLMFVFNVSSRCGHITILGVIKKTMKEELRMIRFRKCGIKIRDEEKLRWQ